jgi:hypothetical protein
LSFLDWPVEHSHLAKVPFALRALARQQMAAGGLRTQNLPASGNLEPFRDGFARLTARNWLRHRARTIAQLTIWRIKDLTIAKIDELEAVDVST